MSSDQPIKLESDINDIINNNDTNINDFNGANQAKGTQDLTNIGDKTNNINNTENEENIDKINDINEVQVNDINDEDEKENIDFLRAPSIIRQLTNNDRANRCNTTLRDVNEIDLKEIDEKEEIFEYGFGAAFSYWPGYTYYPYVSANYSTLKEELLNNKICPISLNDWQDINIKAVKNHQIIQHILGEGSDKNTAYAHYNEHFNEIFNIAHGELISVPHILSILFYTDLTNLPREMKKVCRKLCADETISDVKKRHCQLVNWLKLLFETIVLYGNRYGTSGGGSETVYHGLNRKFYFREFKAKFYIPTSATTEKAIAQNFSEDNGIILEFGRLESFGDPFFDTSSLSIYADEKEYLFFFAELPIKRIFIGITPFDMAPLSLYQSIVAGNIMIDKVQLDKKQYNKTQKKLNKLLDLIEKKDQDIDTYEEEKDALSGADEYGMNLLARFIKHNKTIWINKEELMSKITMPKLREKFIEQNKDKTFKRYSDSLLHLQDSNMSEIKNSDYFKWGNTRNDIANFLGEDGYCCSKVFKCSDRAKFYCQMNVMDKDTARITLILYKLHGGKKEKTVSFDIYCKALNKFYVRFHNITFKLDAQEDDSRQGADFKLKWMKKAYDKEKEVHWKITIGE